MAGSGETLSVLSTVLYCHRQSAGGVLADPDVTPYLSRPPMTHDLMEIARWSVG